MENVKDNTVNVLAFGIAKDILGQQKMEITLPKKATVAILKKELLKRYPEFSRLSSLRFAVNQEYREDAFEIHPSDEVAIIPPVSGG